MLFFKVFIDFLNLLNLKYDFYCMFWFFGHEACGIMVPQPGIEPVPPALGGKVFNHGTVREVPKVTGFSTNKAVTKRKTL